MVPIRWLPPAAALALACCLLTGTGSVLAAEGNNALPPPAGQVCPPGAYVRGFDFQGNILCTGSCGDAVLDVDEGCDDGNVVNGDGCSAICQPERAAAPAATAAPATAAATESATAQAAPQAAGAAGPVIADVEPESVVYGTRETTLTISGTGFGADSVVRVAGESYQPTVSADGTRMEITIATRSLAIGVYAITVANGAGQQVTRKRGLVIY